MKKGLTEIVFILDKSGSMSGLEADTIGGYNAFLENQKKVEAMNEYQYSVGGCTALLDAIGCLRLGKEMESDWSEKITSHYNKKNNK